MPRNNLELKIINLYNRYLEYANISGLAYRHRQSRFVSQFCDIFVDSLNPHFYLAIECKSVDARSVKTLYFKSHFHGTGKDSQIERLYEFCQITGRQGKIAIEQRFGVGHRTIIHILPLSYVYQKYIEGYAGFKLVELPARYRVIRPSERKAEERTSR